MKKDIRVGVMGASGHAGGEICRLLLGHEHVTSIVPSSRSDDAFERLHPNLSGCGLEFVPTDELIARASEFDVVFYCTPSGEAMLTAGRFLDAGVRVIDLSADFRFPDPSQYAEIYGRPHASPDLLPRAVYGITELSREKIQTADLVANPGCYAIAAILGMAPALRHDLIVRNATVHISAVNGTTGASSNPVRETSHAFVAGGMLPYGLEGHRHGPELECHLGALTEQSVSVVMATAHGNFARGILLTITVEAGSGVANHLSRETLTETWRRFYSDGPRTERFVVINKFARTGEMNEKEYHLYPNVARLSGSNYCHIAVDYDKKNRRIKIVSAIDNLVKGAAGSAIQNMNLIFGFPEDASLKAYGL